MLGGPEIGGWAASWRAAKLPEESDGSLIVIVTPRGQELSSSSRMQRASSRAAPWPSLLLLLVALVVLASLVNVRAALLSYQTALARTARRATAKCRTRSVTRDRLEGLG